MNTTVMKQPRSLVFWEPRGYRGELSGLAQVRVDLARDLAGFAPDLVDTLQLCASEPHADCAEYTDPDRRYGEVIRGLCLSDEATVPMRFSDSGGGAPHGPVRKNCGAGQAPLRSVASRRRTAERGHAMTMPRKGTRRITVDGVAYRWRVTRSLDYWLQDGAVVVERADCRGRLLVVTLLAGPGLPITPGQVAAAIHEAGVRGWASDVPGAPFRHRG
ncbi:hypothetical protein AB0I72_01385 [Nocardiopsis sp. NPDC049922]|uniref:hypothetical protein n=1 Tax=Nocardiopsis sp. NPDC049922 TaxID=3155157 RepID=UPI0033ED7B5B